MWYNLACIMHQFCDILTCIADVFRKYNPDLKGPSICVSQYTNAKKSWLNAAEPGGDSS